MQPVEQPVVGEALRAGSEQDQHLRSGTGGRGERVLHAGRDGDRTRVDGTHGYVQLLEVTDRSAS